MVKPDWITITPASGSNNGSFDVTAAANTGLARNGIITVACLLYTSPSPRDA